MDKDPIFDDSLFKKAKKALLDCGVALDKLQVYADCPITEEALDRAAEALDPIYEALCSAESRAVDYYYDVLAQREREKSRGY